MHDLHLTLGSLFNRIRGADFYILRGPECGGAYELSVFFRVQKRCTTRCAKVDAALVVLIEGKPHVVGIIEIEEKAGSSGGFRPERLFGKLMNAAGGVMVSRT
jgi:hypothetical protein